MRFFNKLKNSVDRGVARILNKYLEISIKNFALMMSH